MKSTFLAICLAASAGSAHAVEGPFSHTSDGVTPAYIAYDSAGAIVDLQCVPGSICATRTGSAWLSPWARQYMVFDLQVASPIIDHLSFGVRGNPSNTACPVNPRIKSFPFLGRGLIVIPSTGQVGFENFTGNCMDTAGGVAWSTMRNFDFALTDALEKYRVEVWADAGNTGYRVAKMRYLYAGVWQTLDVVEGDCLAQASAADAYKCGRHPADPLHANRTFLISAIPDGAAFPRWSASDWYLD